MEEQEVLQIVDYSGFFRLIEEQAEGIATLKLLEFFEEYEIDKIDMSLCPVQLDHEFSRFLFHACDSLEKENIFIMKNDIINLIKGLANEMIYKVLGELVDRGECKLAWDDSKKDFIWVQ